MKRALVFFGMTVLMHLGLSAQSLEQNRSNFEAANTAYQEERYADALELYGLIDDSYRNFSVEFNLGNTYYKLDSIGKAILHYERARKFDPKDENLKVNLQLANQKIVDKIEALPTLGVKDLWTNIRSVNMLSTWTNLSLIAIFIAFTFFILALILRSKQIKRIFILTGVLFFIAYTLTYLLARAVVNNEEQNEAIVLSPKVDVKGAPSAQAIDVFLLHEGTKVEIRNEQDSWYEVKIANGNVGWIPISSCEGI